MVEKNSPNSKPVDQTSTPNIREIKGKTGDLAYLLDVSEPRCSQIIREKGFKKDGDGYFALAECVRAFIGGLRKRLGNTGKRNDNSEGRSKGDGDSQADKVALENELLRLKIAEKTGELVPVDQVAKEWERMVMAARQKFLALPAKLAPDLARENEPKAIQAIVEAGVREALLELGNVAEQGKKEVPKKPRPTQPKDPEPIPASPAA